MAVAVVLHLPPALDPPSLERAPRVESLYLLPLASPVNTPLRYKVTCVRILFYPSLPLAPAAQASRPQSSPLVTGNALNNSGGIIGSSPFPPLQAPVTHPLPPALHQPPSQLSHPQGPTTQSTSISGDNMTMPPPIGSTNVPTTFPTPPALSQGRLGPPHGGYNSDAYSMRPVPGGPPALTPGHPPPPLQGPPINPPGVAAASGPPSLGPAKNKKGIKRKADTTTPIAYDPIYSRSSPNEGSKKPTRRESGRPIKKPSKDLPDTAQHVTKGKKGKMTTQMKYCSSILKELFAKKHETYAWPFYKPVDAEGMGLADYHQIITHPMDLGTVKQKMENREYRRPEEFATDIRLIFKNCFRYNPPEHDVVGMAKKLMVSFAH